jgi:hypothetical protein
MKAELFDRYVHEVGRRLPRKQRADVEAELHSLLMDALEDRASETESSEGAVEGAASEADQVAVLEEFGPPAQVAAQYTPPHRYIIGPRLFDIYGIVVAAVAGSLTLAHVILLLLAALGRQDSVTGLGLLQSYISAVVGSFGWITLVFAILERVLPESATRAKEDEEAWDPRTLPEIEDRGRIEVGGLVAEIVFTVIALLIFNLFPQWVGFNFRAAINDAPARWVSIPMLSAAFFELYLPLLNVSWLLKIGLNVVLLRQGQWQRWTRIVDFCLALFSVYILWRMVFGPSLLTMEGIRSASLRETLGRILPLLLKLALGIGLVVTIVESVGKLIRVFGADMVSVYGRLAGRPTKR